MPLPFRFLTSAVSAFFRPLAFSFQLLSLLFLPFQPSRFCFTAASPVRHLRFRFRGFPLSLRPDFSCLPSRFLYSAFCSFPFVLPGFAPTAVPPVLPLCFRFRAFPALKLSFVRFSLGSDYSAFRTFFSLLPVFPWRRFPRCIFPLPSGLLPCRPSDSGTQLSAIPFSVLCFASQKLPQCPDPCGRFPLAYALGAGYSAIKTLFSGSFVRSST